MGTTDQISAPKQVKANDRVKATDREKALAVEILQHFRDQKYEQAKALLAQALKSSEHPRFKRIQARFDLFEGCEADASKTIKNILPQIWNPGSWELALADNGFSRARLLQDQKILYFPLRKCGSTSLLNMMKTLAGEDMRGEHIHQEDHKRVSINLDKMGTDYPGYFACTVVRDPVGRLMSFFHGNIIGREHLKQEYDGLTEFYDLPTKPGLDYFLENLARYRQVFISVRDHTEPLVTSIGTKPEVFDWIGGLSKIADLAATLSARSGIDLPLLQEMESVENSTPPQPEMPDAVQSLYAADHKVYSAFF